MVSVAAGMASTGLIPFAATFAAYLALLGCEQIRTDCAYTGMPVRILAHHSGMSLGYYGTSHHALEDLAIMRAIADLTVVCAADANQLRAILRALARSAGRHVHPARARPRPGGLPRGAGRLRHRQGIRLREGSDLTLIATGSEVRACLDAAESLAADGIEARVVDMHTIDPLDHAEVSRRPWTRGPCSPSRSTTSPAAWARRWPRRSPKRAPASRFRRHGVPDEHVVLGPPAALYDHYRLDAAGVEAVARELIGAERQSHTMTDDRKPGEGPGARPRPQAARAAP